MLFEAFDTKAISKVTDFIRKKLGSEESQEFLKFLRKAQKSLDFPLSKISDKDIEYLNAKKALKINNKEKSENEHELYCLKFWFSMDHGFIGVSGVGNYTADFLPNDSAAYRGKGLTQDDIDYVKNELGIKTGKLKRILTNEDYRTLNHGDYIVANLKSDINKRFLTLGRIFKDGVRLFAIHDNDNSDGGYPEYYDTSRAESGEWSDWGRYSWSLGYVNSPGDDHRNMYKYIPGDEPLEIIGDVRKEETSPFEFNLPFNSKFKLKPWSNYMEDDWSFQHIENREHFGWEQIEKSDFCIVLYLDDLLKESKPSETSKQRKESREGATALMSDEEIKNANIERYVSMILAKMGVSKDKPEFKNIQNYIKTYICGDYSFFSIYTNRPSIDRIKNFQKNLYILLRTYNNYTNEKDDKEYWERELNIIFTIINRSYREDLNSANAYRKRYNSNYTRSMDILSKKEFENKELVKDFYTKLKNIGEYINKYFSSKKISSISELLFIHAKLSAISNIVDDSTIEFSYNLRNAIMDFRYELSDYDLNYMLDRINGHIEEDLKKLNEIERFIKSILS